MELHHLYLTELYTPVAASTGRRHLRSAAHSDLLVPRTRTITYGPCSFAVSGPCVWNDLPPTLCVSPRTLRQFQGALKTKLFCSAYGTWHDLALSWLFRPLEQCVINLLTYLLTVLELFCDSDGRERAAHCNKRKQLKAIRRNADVNQHTNLSQPLIPVCKLLSFCLNVVFVHLLHMSPFHFRCFQFLSLIFSLSGYLNLQNVVAVSNWSLKIF